MCRVWVLKFLKSTLKFRSPGVWLVAGPALAGAGELDALSSKFRVLFKGKYYAIRILSV